MFFPAMVVAILTAFSVSFSPFVSLTSAVPAIIAGYASEYIAHKYLSSSAVRKLLGVIFYILAIKFALKFLHTTFP